MSISSDADPVQPQEGQGEPGTSDAPYAEHLSRIPEEFRDQVEPVFRDWDGQVTKRFQDYATQAKEWEPYSDVKQYDPDAVQNALAFYQAASNDPQAIKEWYESQYAPAHGLVDQTAPPPADPQQPDMGLGGEYGGFDQGQQIQQLLQQALDPLQKQLEGINSWRQQQEQAAQVAYGQQIIDQQLGELAGKHGDEFNREWVETRAAHYVDTDPGNAIPRAWADYQALVNQISKQVMQSKEDAPAAPESGGVPDVNPPQIKTLKDAEKYALAQLRGQSG